MAETFEKDQPALLEPIERPAVSVVSTPSLIDPNGEVAPGKTWPPPVTPMKGLTYLVKDTISAIVC